MPVLRLGFELARRGYRRYSAYPGATWAGVFTNEDVVRRIYADGVGSGLEHP